MALAVVKEKLHDYIEHADDKKIKALYTLLESEIEPDYELSEADMIELDRRWDNYLSGKSKSIPLEESMKNIKKHREERRKNVV